MLTLLLANHIALHDNVLLLAMAVAALVISIVVLVQSHLGSLVAWATGILSLALVIDWWPE